MAIVLALVIVGWLVAFVLGAQAGFDNEAAVAAEKAPVAQAATAKSVAYKETVSAS